MLETDEVRQRVLREIETTGAATASALVSALGVPYDTVVVSLSRLAREGQVTVEPKDGDLEAAAAVVGSAPRQRTPRPRP